MEQIDWANIPLKEFAENYRFHEQEKRGEYYRPRGEGKAQDVLAGLMESVRRAYEDLLPSEVGEDGDYVNEPYLKPEEIEGKDFVEGNADLVCLEDVEVPVDRRSGRREYKPFNTLTLKDLPDVLDTLTVLEHQQQGRLAKEAERKAAERKKRERARAKERRKLKKLGEW